jgi:hypothetical protein
LREFVRAVEYSEVGPAPSRITLALSPSAYLGSLASAGDQADDLSEREADIHARYIERRPRALVRAHDKALSIAPADFDLSFSTGSVQKLGELLPCLGVTVDSHFSTSLILTSA